MKATEQMGSLALLLPPTAQLLPWDQGREKGWGVAESVLLSGAREEVGLGGEEGVQGQM